MSQPTYKKHFIPLESHPQVFTNLAISLGLNEEVEFQDIWSLDDDALRPKLTEALILIFPTTDAYEARKADEEASREEYAGTQDDDDIVFYKQTINNACGLYAILHAAANAGKQRHSHICQYQHCSSSLMTGIVNAHF